MRYALVKDKVIVKGPMGLPASWENISGLSNMSDLLLSELGWLPYKLVETPGDIVTGSKVKINKYEIVETQITRMRSADDLSAATEALASEMRAKRDELLKACDWTMLPDAPVNRESWAAYRRDLRELPKQEEFPHSISWPIVT